MSAAMPPPVPGPNYGSAIVASQIVFLVMIIGAVTLRVIARHIGRRGLGATDYTIFVALLLNITICAGNLWGVQQGFLGIGVASMTLPELEMFFKLVFATSLFNFAALGISKISIALFYKTIFTNAKFRMIMNVYIGVVAAWMFVSMLLELIAVQPIEAWWSPVPNVVLFNRSTYIAVVTALNMVLDITLLCMPLFVIGQLKMTLMRKFQSGGILALGFLVCVGSALHLYFGTQLNGTDATIITGNFITASLEVSGSVVTACLPTFAPLLRAKRWQRLFRTVDSTKDSSKGSKGSKPSLSSASRSRSRNNEPRNRPSQPSLSGFSRNWPGQTNSYTIRSGMGKDIEVEPLHSPGITLKHTFGAESHPVYDDIEMEGGEV